MRIFAGHQNPDERNFFWVINDSAFVSENTRELNRGCKKFSTKTEKRQISKRERSMGSNLRLPEIIALQCSLLQFLWLWYWLLGWHYFTFTSLEVCVAAFGKDTGLEWTPTRWSSSSESQTSGTVKREVKDKGVQSFHDIKTNL